MGGAVAAWSGAAVGLTVGGGHPGREVVVVVGAVACAGTGWGRRSLVLVAVGLAALGAVAGVRADRGLVPVAPGPFAGEVTLVDDPVPMAGGVRVDVAAGGRRLELRAPGPSAGAVVDRLAGERVVVRGALRPAGGGWRRVRHVTGALVATSVAPGRGADPLAAAGNTVHRLLGRGATPLSRSQAALLAGLVVGDDRHLPAEVVDALRAGGLGHLTAVSGQNVAFLLAVAGPALRRAGPGGRPVLVLALLALFVTVTRAEPSVVRAAAMASIAALGVALGRPVAGPALLALAVTALVVADPLLVGSLGFQLSVAAAGGIVVLARPLADRLPGPRVVAAPVAVTLAAQLAVAPLLVAAGLPVPLAAVVVNPLAGPAAGAVMAWGLTGGLVAGLLPPLAPVLHLPTRPALAAVTGAAGLADRLPLGDLDRRTAPVVALVVVAVAVAARAGRRRLAALALAAGAVALVLVPPVGPALGDHTLGPGASLHVGRTGRVLVLDGRADAGAVLGGLRRRGVDRLDLVVDRSGASRARRAAEAVRHRWPAVPVLGPDEVVGRRRLRVGDLEVVVGPGPPLEVAVGAPGAGVPVG